MMQMQVPRVAALATRHLSPAKRLLKVPELVHKHPFSETLKQPISASRI
jgi:hypothetical protein